MKHPLLTSMTALSLLLLGCASSAEKTPPLPDLPSSEALRIARAAGFQDIHDVDLRAARSIDPQSGSVLKPAKAAAIGTGLMKGTPGIPSPVEVLLLFVNSSPRARPEEARRLIAWMPKEMASSPQEAVSVLRDVWTRAVAAALPGVKVEFVDELYERKPLLARNSMQHRRYIGIDSPSCSPCRISSQAIGGAMLPVEVQAPEFLGSAPAYFWGGMGKRGESSFGGYPWTAADLTIPQKLAFLKRVSANLPPWAYLYLPNFQEPERLADVPLILHQGDELQFQSPQVTDPTP